MLTTTKFPVNSVTLTCGGGTMIVWDRHKDSPDSPYAIHDNEEDGSKLTVNGVVVDRFSFLRWFNSTRGIQVTIIYDQDRYGHVIEANFEDSSFI